VVIDDYAHAGFKGARLGVDYVVDKYRNDISEHGFSQASLLHLQKIRARKPA